MLYQSCCYFSLCVEKENWVKRRGRTFQMEKKGYSPSILRSDAFLLSVLVSFLLLWWSALTEAAKGERVYPDSQFHVPVRCRIVTVAGTPDIWPHGSIARKLRAVIACSVPFFSLTWAQELELATAGKMILQTSCLEAYLLGSSRFCWTNNHHSKFSPRKKAWHFKA